MRSSTLNTTCFLLHHGHNLDFKVTVLLQMRVHDGDRVINSACAGRRIKPGFQRNATQRTQCNQLRKKSAQETQ